MTKLALTATVRLVPNKGGKVKILTHATIRLNGGKALAFAILGGAYNETQAVNNFRRNPGKWEVQSGNTPEQLAFYAEAA